MSILNNIRRGARSVWALLFPPLCPVCRNAMCEGEQVICNHCRLKIPLTDYIGHIDNKLERKLWGLTIFVQASALYFYIEESPYRRIVHAFKYGGDWRLARDMGEWYGGLLARSKAYDDIDVIIPVPLHPLRRMWRGYNQSEYLAEGIARMLHKPVDCRSLRRHTYTISQTRHSKHKRWDNVMGCFSTRRGADLSGRHILLVDDVLTTGSTVCACSEALREAFPDCRISIAALAVSYREMNDIF